MTKYQTPTVRSGPIPNYSLVLRTRIIRKTRTQALAAPPLQSDRKPRIKPSSSTEVNPKQDSRQKTDLWLWNATKDIATTVYGYLRVDRRLWSGPAELPRSRVLEKADLLNDTAQRAVQENPLKESPRKNGDVKAPPPNIHSFLSKVGIMEIRYIRMLASLCSLTYSMTRMSEKSLYRRHGLKLVTTSLIYEKMVKEVPQSVSQVYEEADGMAASPKMVAGAYEELLKSADKEVPAMQALVKLKETEPLEKLPTPAEIVGARLSMIAAAAAAAASNAASAAASAAVPLAANLSSAAVGMTAAPMQAVSSQLQWAASIGQSTAVATVATVTAALESSWSHKPVTKKQAISSSYWFVADDARAHTRFFAIQGSNNIDHWRINLQFDPVCFEDPSLGLKVHRGFYEAAKILYDQLLPLVEEHLASSPFAKIVFTGHSLGGSLSTLLMLMFLHRKIISPLALGPVYTFGAPTIFCETAPIDSKGSPVQDNDGETPTTSTNGEAVLERIGLNGGAIRNVMMHRDLVPRAFACDYTLVADLLSRVSDSFRNLEALQDSHHKQMYYHLGRTLVLQPDEAQRFVHGGADHPMLPAGPNLFTMREPWSLTSAAGKLKGRLNSMQTSAGSAAKSLCSPLRSERSRAKSSVRTEVTAERRRTGEANLGEDGSNIDDSGPDRLGGACLGAPVKSVADAIAALMDTPHPLDILGEPGSYGFTGAISRYHDPEHYCKALGGVLRARNRPWRDKTKSLPSSGQATGSDIPRLHHIEAPLKRSRKYRNPEPGVVSGQLLT